MSADKSPNSQLDIVVISPDELYEKINKSLTPNQLEKLLDNYVSLVNPNGLGSPPGQSNKNQVTEVEKGSTMQWTIKLGDEKDNKDYKVLLDSINQELQDGSKSYFTQNPLVEPNRDGSITGIVSGIGVPDGTEEAYTIYFYITKDNVSKGGPLPIDPKLQIRQKT